MIDNGPNTIDPKTGRPYISSDELYGLLAIPGQPAPTDEDIERMLMERYAEWTDAARNPNLDKSET